jgi:hypothetical protein
MEDDFDQNEEPEEESDREVRLVSSPRLFTVS